MRVYIAGPYTLGNPEANTQRMIFAADKILQAGHAPFVPLLTHYWHTLIPNEYDAWLRLDLAWLRVSEALIRLPGESKGADIEVQEAKHLGLPVWSGETPIEDFLDGKPPTIAKGAYQCADSSECILDEAKRLTSRDRHNTYGHPLDDYTRTAQMVSAIIGVPISPEKMQLCMIAVKLSRLCHTPNHRDSIVDIAGYSNCYAMTLAERKRREEGGKVLDELAEIGQEIGVGY